ncbi:NnrS family protein [Roseospira visakhapatnamensis]|uniref:Uncharacterized protein involved in response to NO n=1 Tax=Roseospira visakhapatnamensis TaxID=390880 RepID=A0A7W6RGF9_9PROT|nr:NnrS family protein [Roseospira visakhapatnamensis]MBB4268088.1 uncharacterized protein involved in response to NO [Roseospira visakhapatnamensis]
MTQALRPRRTPAALSLGMRPFFPLAALHGAAVVGLWVPWYLGWLSVPSALPPAAWHAHELLFGFLPAILAGFLLTAVPNWTGRAPVVGLPLAGLVTLWLAGRAGMALSDALPPMIVAALVTAFPALLTAVTAREIVTARNWRNLGVVAGMTALTVAPALFHWELAREGWSPYAESLAIAAALTLIMIVGGRIVPTFTTNWVRKANPGREPAPPGAYDRLALGVGTLALAGWVARPAVADGSAAALTIAALLGTAAGLVAVRQARWVPHRTLGEPLVTVLHVAHAFVPVGFLLAALAVAWPAAGLDSAVTHTWTIGAITLMSLAVMTRAARGHTGHALTAPPATVALYAGILVAVLTRITVVLVPSLTLALLPVTAVAWGLALLGYVVLYGPMLMRPRPSA